MMTIYDAMALQNVSFSLFMNSTCGFDNITCCGPNMTDPMLNCTPSNCPAGSHCPPTACPRCSHVASIQFPDVGMAGVARHKSRFKSQELFYRQSAAGQLPSFSWLMPPSQACDHPCEPWLRADTFSSRPFCVSTGFRFVCGSSLTRECLSPCRPRRRQG
jgi:hypothetical protein